MRTFSLFVLLISSMVSAQWTEWTATPDAACSAPCGMCGEKVIATRTCPSPGTCPGDAQKKETCPTKLCLFPKKTCCKGYVKSLVANKLVCAPKKTKRTKG